MHPSVGRFLQILCQTDGRQQKSVEDAADWLKCRTGFVQIIYPPVGQKLTPASRYRGDWLLRPVFEIMNRSWHRSCILGFEPSRMWADSSPEQPRPPTIPNLTVCCHVEEGNCSNGVS